MLSSSPPSPTSRWSLSSALSGAPFRDVRTSSPALPRCAGEGAVLQVPPGDIERGISVSGERWKVAGRELEAGSRKFSASCRKVSASTPKVSAGRRKVWPLASRFRLAAERFRRLGKSWRRPAQGFGGSGNVFGDGRKLSACRAKVSAARRKLESGREMFSASGERLRTSAESFRRDGECLRRAGKAGRRTPKGFGGSGNPCGERRKVSAARLRGSSGTQTCNGTSHVRRRLAIFARWRFVSRNGPAAGSGGQAPSSILPRFAGEDATSRLC